MNRDEVKNVLTIVIGIALIIIAVKFFIYLLPIILVLILGYLIYRRVILNNNLNINKTKSTNSKRNDKKVIEGTVISEKNSD